MREHTALAHSPEGYLDFHDEYRGLIAELASLGFTPTQVHRRLRFLYPSLNQLHLDYALNSGIWQFGPVTADAPSHLVLACGLWYIFAEAYDLPPEHEYATLLLDSDIIHDLPPALEARHIGREDIATILGKIGASFKYLAAHPYSQLDEDSYTQTVEDLRLRGLLEGGLYGRLSASMGGDSAWPAPAQSISDQLGEGDWSLAMLRTGICPAEALDQDWDIEAASVPDNFAEKTLSLFLSYCSRYNRQPTVLTYGYWSTIPTTMGKVPTLGAVRAKYGSWQVALHRGRTTIARELRLWTTTEEGVAETGTLEPSADEKAEEYTAEQTSAKNTPAAAFSVRDLAEQGIGVVQTTHRDLAAYHRARWNHAMEIFADRLAHLPWSRCLSTYYFFDGATVDEADPAPVVTVFRSPTGFLCELETTVEALPAFDTEYLQQHGWTRPVPAHPRWNLHVLDPVEASRSVIDAMRLGMGCERWDYYRTDGEDESVAEEAEAASV